MKTYSVTLRYQHRKWGPSGETVRVDASNVYVAISKAVRQFLETLDRRERFDAGKGMDVKALLIGDALAKLEEASPEVYAMVDKLIDGK